MQSRGQEVQMKETGTWGQWLVNLWDWWGETRMVVSRLDIP